ncbi:MAG: hypothetical protein ACI9MJ_000939 [Alphaproteobacteria bacterium]
MAGDPCRKGTSRRLKNDNQAPESTDNRSAVKQGE